VTEYTVTHRFLNGTLGGRWTGMDVPPPPDDGLGRWSLQSYEPVVVDGRCIITALWMRDRT